MKTPLCSACGKNPVIWPILVCWWCRQAGVPVPKAPRRRGKKRPYASRKRWTPADDELLRRTYADTSSTELLKLFPGRPIGSIYQHAASLGLKKSRAYLTDQRREEVRRLREHGQAYRFPKGHVPANKGKKGRPSTGRMAETQFKKGNKPHTWLPVGTTRFDKDGYLQRKVSDTGYPPRDWRNVHVLLWEEAHGPVPPKHRVVFRNGDKTDIRLENLELISFAEAMRRNTIHRAEMPEEIRSVLRQIGGLRRRITMKERKHGKERDGEDDRGPEGPAVQDGRAAGRGDAGAA